MPQKRLVPCLVRIYFHGSCDEKDFLAHFGQLPFASLMFAPSIAVFLFHWQGWRRLSSSDHLAVGVLVISYPIQTDVEAARIVFRSLRANGRNYGLSFPNQVLLPFSVDPICYDVSLYF